MPRPARANGTEPSASDNAQRILRVAERLFAQKGFRATTVRDIARAAHVTHPLVYHYFGSKRGLLAAAVERSQSRMRAVAERGGEPRDVIAGLVRDNLAGNRLYLRTLTRAFADGMQPADWPGGFPAVEAILAMLSGERPGGDSQAWETEVRELIAVSVAMAVGWAVLQDQLLEVVGLSAEHRDEARERLVQAFVEILRPALPPDRS